MQMWMVTVAPKEDFNAWSNFVDQGVIGIGWPERDQDDDPRVKRFCSIRPGDLVVAHVTPNYGGDSCLAKGLGVVTGEYEEISKSQLRSIGDGWDGAFRRQYKVNWKRIKDITLRDVVRQYRLVVKCMSDEEQRQILERFDY